MKKALLVSLIFFNLRIEAFDLPEYAQSLMNSMSKSMMDKMENYLTTNDNFTLKESTKTENNKSYYLVEIKPTSNKVNYTVDVNESGYTIKGENKKSSEHTSFSSSFMISKSFPVSIVGMPVIKDIPGGKQIQAEIGGASSSESKRTYKPKKLDGV